MRTIRYALEVSVDKNGSIRYSDDIEYSDDFIPNEAMICVVKTLQERIDLIKKEIKIS